MEATNVVFIRRKLYSEQTWKDDYYLLSILELDGMLLIRTLYWETELVHSVVLVHMWPVFLVVFTPTFPMTGVIASYGCTCSITHYQRLNGTLLMVFIPVFIFRWTRMRRRFGSTLCKKFYFTSKLSEKILDNFWLWIYFFIEIPSSNCFSTDTLQFPPDEIILGWIISNTSVQISNHHSRFPGIRLTLQKTLILNGYRGCIVLLYHGVMILLINNQNQLLDILMWISLEMKEPCSIIDAQHYRFAILVTTSSLSLFLISQHSIGTNNCFSFRSILHCSRVEKSSGLESRVYHEWMVNWIAMQ